MTIPSSRRSQSHPDRRDFLARSGALLGGAWLGLSVPLLQACGEAARVAADEDRPLRFLTPDQHEGLEALTARIIPTDETPGAREARVARFLDHLFAENLVPGMEAPALATLEMADAMAVERGGANFAALAGADQDAVLTALSDDPRSPFGALWAVTMMGMFANPEYGGNAGEVGWRLLGFERAASFDPPFGHYDRVYRENGGVA